MLVLQGTGRSKKMMGRKLDGEVELISGLLAARKHVIDDKGWRDVSQAKHLFAFVSSPIIYEQPRLRKIVKGWCHPFRRPEQYLPKGTSSILLPESDFMDPAFVLCSPIKRRKHDYFYFTLNAKAGIRHKGLYQFIESLPTLCKHKLKGLIVVYFPNAGLKKAFKVRLTLRQKNILKDAAPFLTYHWGLLKPIQMNEAMQSCKFGFFPNTVDNSPRLISESLIRNIPILVNKEIHGGWHYVHQQSGSLFGVKTLDKAIDFMMTQNFSPRDFFTSNFGFEKSAAKLSKFVSGIFGYEEYTHMYFRDFVKYLHINTESAV